MTNNTLLAIQLAERWQGFWQGDIGAWILTRGVRIALLVIGGLLAARFISWSSQKFVRRIDVEFQESDDLVRPESAKHRQAVASVVSWVSVAVLFVVVAVEITDILSIPVGSLVAPAAVLGAALGFGAQRIVQDLLSGFFIITEKQYGFGDLVQLTLGSSNDAMGTVEDVTLRVTKLRTAEGEMYTIPNGQIMKSLNLSKDWARAVVDIPVPASADLNEVNDVLHDVAERAKDDTLLSRLLLDAPQLMGVESIEVDTVNLRMVARTLPGKQFEVGRRLRVLVVRALARAGIVTVNDPRPMVGAIVHPATSSGAEQSSQGLGGAQAAVVKLNLRSDGDDAEEVKAWPGYIFWGRLRTSTAALIVAFCTLFWVYQTFQPEPTAPPASQVVPPGFIPDPDYTWVPRTQLAPRPTTTTTTTTTTPTTTTTDSSDTTTPSLAPGQTPTTTMLGPATLVDPDGAGPLPPQLLTTTPTTTPTTVTATPTTTTTPAPPS